MQFTLHTLTVDSVSNSQLKLLRKNHKTKLNIENKRRSYKSEVICVVYETTRLSHGVGNIQELVNTYHTGSTHRVLWPAYYYPGWCCYIPTRLLTKVASLVPQVECFFPPVSAPIDRDTDSLLPGRFSSEVQGSGTKKKHTQG